MSLFSGAGRSTAVLGDGNDFAQIGGHVLLDPASGRLLADALPPWIHVPAASPQATIFRWRSEEHTSELQSLMRISYAVFCLKKKHNHYVKTAPISYHSEHLIFSTY